ncbi:MAG: NAD(P)-dependent alcohol dehydrogenase [Propionicimonas sp.]|uniref:NAD(P)-dependent alcohol dehydrogenase n=1 Tax=Propionicimonas sp. TaxID=1955623 RepID=UPI002B216992|nr:NAD(P)-dependent alcohol dehydrogenase [Propionicimonas sp.]MEA4944819.1 NAD(P)-dependent alcohol dehydrogenase [Propionicimonas sp.]
MTQRTMKRAVYRHYGGPAVLTIDEVPIPTPGKGQVLVRMRSTSVNGGDLQARSGQAKFRTAMSPGWPKQLGMDVVGVVEQVGPGVASPQVGEQVWGVSTGDGAYAQYVLMAANRVGRLPQGMDPVRAGALPVAGTTALLALGGGSPVRSGQRVLVRGAGGVGLAAVQLAHARGAEVTALASGSTLAGVADAGADRVLDYREADPSRLGRFDLVLDTVGTAVASFRQCLTPTGRLLTITADFSHPFRSIGQILASVRFGGRRTRFVTGIPRTPQLDALADAVEAGQLRPVIDSVFALEQISQAHARAEQRGILGKIVISID